MENGKDIYAALAAVMADVGCVSKDKVNKQQGFKFRSIDDVYNALHPALAKHKVVIVPNILERTSSVVGKTAKGTDMTKVVCTIEFTFFAQDGSNIKATIIGEGLDTGDKATNKAMAIAYKYACFQVFCIPTEEMTDPDAESIEIGDAEKKSQKAKSATKSQASKKSGTIQENSESTQRITEAMLRTIRAEQMRTGVNDAQILGIKSVSAKTIPELTVDEFNKIMKKFSGTPDLNGGKDE